MRVVFVARAPFLSGAERSLQLLLEALPAHGVSPAVVAPGESPILPWCARVGLPHVPCLLSWPDKWHPVRWWRSVRQVKAALRGLGAELVHSNQLWSYPPVGVAGRSLGLPRVCHMRDEAGPDAVRWWCSSGVDGVLTVSRHIADMVRPAWPAGSVPPIEVVMGPAVVPDLPGPAERRERRAAARKALGLAADAVVFGFIGQVAPVKGLTQLIDALALVPGDWQLAVAGRDPAPGAPYETVCREQADRLGLGDRCRFLGFRDDVRPFYEAVNAVVVPSLEEPLARVLYEAGGYARPVIAYATGGLPEAIRHGETGWLVPRGDVAGLRERLRAFLDHSETEVGLAAREWVETAAAPGAYAAKVVGLYRRLLGPASNSPTPAPAVSSIP